MSQNKKIAQIVKWVDDKANRSQLAKAAPEDFDLTAWKRQVTHLLELDHHNEGKLAKCTPRSLWLGITKAADLGLRFDLNECYLVPYGTRAVFQFDYRGLIKLAKRSGQIRHVKALVVREGDFHESWHDPEPHFIHKPASFNERPIIGAAALFYFTDGGFEFEELNLKEIAAIRAKAAAGSMMWNEFFEEGCKKAAIRRGIKTLELNPRDLRAILEADRDEYDFLPKKVSATTINDELGLDVVDVVGEPVSQVDEEDEPAEPAEPAEPEPSESSAVRALAQLMRYSSADEETKEAAKERFAHLTEPEQETWLLALKDTETGEERGLMVQDLSEIEIGSFHGGS